MDGGSLRIRWLASPGQQNMIPQDAQKGDLLTRPTLARQDAPFREQGRSGFSHYL